MRDNTAIQGLFKTAITDSAHSSLHIRLYITLAVASTQMKMMMNIGALVVSVALFQVAAQENCLDLSQSVCGKYGINVKVPTLMYKDIAAFNKAYEVPDKPSNASTTATPDNPCPNLDSSGLKDNTVHYLCLTLTPLTYGLSALLPNGTDLLSKCNGGKVEYPEELLMCKSSCESYFKASVDYAAKRGCSALGTVVNATSIENSCKLYPTSNCKAVTFSSALSQAKVSVVSIALLAVVSYLLI
ncbi:hypothetical protein MP228_006217 [Amoeboaphelidium protococcarum]|nr:hypothetical protein MP228_006217 [Amoeboaphelidium protococcarum]